MIHLLTRRVVSLFAFLSALAASPAGRACGPEFLDCYLGSSFDEQTVLPTLGFDAELRRLLTPAEAANRSRESVAQESTSEDAAELAEVNVYMPALKSYERQNPPSALPEEFQLYGKGARWWHSGDAKAAADAWRALLALPPGQRHFRSTWAAYMLGRSAARNDEAALATSYWAQTRELARAGFGDSRHLATASMGDTAFLALEDKNFSEALSLYWRQYVLGDPTARGSIQLALKQVFLDAKEPDPQPLREISAQPELRQVVTGWFVARGGPNLPWNTAEQGRFKAWLSVLSQGTELSPDESDRWAWAAYSTGEWEAAQRFADAAPSDAPASEWVRALLLLRRGKLEPAAAHLANAARAFQTDSNHPPLVGPDDDNGYGEAGYFYGFACLDPGAALAGIRGSLALSREQYIESLRLFRSAHHGTDAAYVAEKVLTMEELRSFVDHEAPDDVEMRSLLARRLSRAGQFDGARPYYSEADRPAFDAYVQAARVAYDPGQPRACRAAAFWTAAQITRNRGMDLFGTALEPDFALYGGSFVSPTIADSRMIHYPAFGAYDGHNPASGQGCFLPTTNDECLRYDEAGTPTHRYHYRYRAAELAMLAADLSPDDDPTTATILVTAGNWVGRRDPEAAEIFYKTLVIRCPHTELGRRASELHWIPKI